MNIRFTFMAALLATFPGLACADALEGKPTVGEVMESAGDADWRVFDQEDLLYFELQRGTVIVALSPSLARRHTKQMRALAREHFYDGLSFYRVIEGFVAQGGDALEKREVQDAAKTLKAEFDEDARDDIHFDPLGLEDGYAPSVGFIESLPAGYDPENKRYWHLHCTGAIAMARGVEKDTAGTEFYIALQPQRYLDRNLTVFGRVIDGMEHVEALRRVAPPESEDDDRGETILSVRVGSDLPADKQKSFRILRSDRPVFRDLIEARKNRASAFFYYRPDYIDVCQFPVPVEPVLESASE